MNIIKKQQHGVWMHISFSANYVLSNYLLSGGLSPVILRHWVKVGPEKKVPIRNSTYIHVAL